MSRGAISYRAVVELSVGFDDGGGHCIGRDEKDIRGGARMGALGSRGRAGSIANFCDAYLDSKWTGVWACALLLFALRATAQGGAPVPGALITLGQLW